MNAGLPPTGLPAYLAYASCHSVSNHPPVRARPCFRSLFPSARVHCPAGLLRQQRRGSSQYGKHGRRDGLRSALAGSSHRLAQSSSRCSSTMILGYGLAVHLWQLATPCRHDAVAFGHRPVILRPDGDSHPAMQAPSQAHEHTRLACQFGCPARTIVTPSIWNRRRKEVCGTRFSARRRKPHAGGVCSPKRGVASSFYFGIRVERTLVLTCVFSRMHCGEVSASHSPATRSARVFHPSLHDANAFHDMPGKKRGRASARPRLFCCWRTTDCAAGRSAFPT